MSARPDARPSTPDHTPEPVSMATTSDSIVEPEGRIPVAGRADLVVVGGGPAGISAAVAGARNGLSVILLERYAYLGGLASGGMVLVLDDMCNGAEISV